MHDFLSSRHRRAALAAMFAAMAWLVFCQGAHAQVHAKHPLHAAAPQAAHHGAAQQAAHHGAAQQAAHHSAGHPTAHHHGGAQQAAHHPGGSDDAQKSHGDWLCCEHALGAVTPPPDAATVCAPLAVATAPVTLGLAWTAIDLSLVCSPRAPVPRPPGSLFGRSILIQV